MNCISHLKVNFNSMRSYTRNSVSFIVVYLHTLRQLACNKYAVRFPIISESLVIKLNSTHVRRCLGNYDSCCHAGDWFVILITVKMSRHCVSSNLSLSISTVAHTHTSRQIASNIDAVCLTIVNKRLISKADSCHVIRWFRCWTMIFIISSTTIVFVAVVAIVTVVTIVTVIAVVAIITIVAVVAVVTIIAVVTVVIVVTALIFICLTRGFLTHMHITCFSLVTIGVLNDIMPRFAGVNTSVNNHFALQLAIFLNNISRFIQKFHARFFILFTLLQPHNRFANQAHRDSFSFRRRSWRCSARVYFRRLSWRSRGVGIRRIVATTTGLQAENEQNNQPNNGCRLLPPFHLGPKILVVVHTNTSI